MLYCGQLLFLASIHILRELSLVFVAYVIELYFVIIVTCFKAAAGQIHIG